MIAIIDYKMGNLRSVENALHRLGATYQVTADAQTIRQADHVLLPGVGNCAEAMHNLQESGLIPVIKQLRQPVLGICVGLQGNDKCTYHWIKAHNCDHDRRRCKEKPACSSLFRNQSHAFFLGIHRNSPFQNFNVRQGAASSPPRSRKFSYFSFT